ncbi:hypothetical protein [Nocardioides bizhenqiangii]|uniref:Uncharacterized protein n=1 Tax=Nocardioides bizhenqiangii TaxID=3095076 RepID=A0ABZ0ZNC6_9ACTN|nr:hypothetical protein [Nocardioides sp. HM61]WQQ25775.1 hypothetical protein SHK19_17630 [Nocardioides sp. HM61]
MSDFDERLSAVLTAEADDAPHGSGLAEAARRRHVVRRRRRIAAGGVVAALVILAPVAVLAGGGAGDDKTASDPTPPAQPWQTISQDDVRVEIPGDWREFRCDFDGFSSDIYGPSEDDACGFGEYVAFYGSATFDPAERPGVITGNDDGTARWGYVYAGDLAVSSSTEDRDLTRRILASARASGQPVIDGSGWETVEGAGLRYDAPAFWGLGPDADLGGYAVCALAGDRDDPPDTADRTRAGADAYIVVEYRGGRWISVSAPTAAVGDLVMASVEPDPGNTGIGCVPGI